MAEKRMFAKSIVLSDAFLDMPMSARCLYFTLGMLADDDGFVGGPKSIMRQCGASQDDLMILLQKRYILAFDSGVIVIKHWRINNYLQNDRTTPTTYQEELSTLTLDEKKAYTEKDNSACIHDVYNPYTQNSIEENSRVESRVVEKKIISAEPQGAPALTMQLNDGSEFPIYQDYIDQMKELYPAVDVEQEFRNMKAWCINNPTKRKTKTGIRKFIGNWLAKEQNRGGRGKDGKTGNPFLTVNLEGI